MKKKKVLILAYDFPPYISVGGMRPYGWFKYLPKELYDVTVVTRQWSSQVNSVVDCILPTSTQFVEEEYTNDGRILRAPFEPNLRDKLLIKYGFDKFGLLRKGMSFFIDLLKHSFRFFDSSRTIYKAANSLCEKESFDVIIATGEPFILFKHARQLSKKHNIKWVADYRDGWTTNQRKEQLGLLQKILLVTFISAEKRYINSSSLITTASPSYKDSLLSLFPNKGIEVVLNGFIKNENKVVPVQPEKVKIFEISYLGTLYEHQKIESFIEKVKLFISDNKLMTSDFKVKFIGMNFYEEQKERVLKCAKGIEHYLLFTDKIAYEKLVSEVEMSSLLLLLSKENLNWLNAKVFDYMLFNKRVLFYENDKSILEELLLDVANQTYYCSDDNAIYKALNDSYQEFLLKGSLINQNNENVNKYSREHQTLILSDCLSGLFTD